MKNENIRVPKLRFKEFSGEWEERKLGQIVKLVDSLHQTPKEYVNTGLPMIRVTDVNNGILNLNLCLKVKEEVYKEFTKKYKPKKDDIIMSRVGTCGASIILKFNDNVCLGQNTVLLTDSENQDYLFKLINSNIIQNQVNSKVVGSTQKTLSLKDLKNFNILLPQKQEQEKIASFLSSIDKKINQLSKKDELLQNYKKAMMQKIFSQKLRFKKEDGSDYPKWEEFRLKEVLDYEQPTKYIVKSTEYCDSYDIPVLTAGKTFILGYTNEKQGIYSKSPVIIFDDFTTANHYVDFDFKIKSSAMKLLKEKNKNVNLKFVYEFIQRLHFPLGEHKRYWISEYSYLKIKLPSIEEQTKIANFLYFLDTKISQNRKALEETQKFKKALLQKMFV